MARDADTWLVLLDLAECEELLRTADLGRLGVLVDGKPEVFPVCHVFVDGAIAFPTGEGSKMHAALTWPYVGFEVDGIDDDGMTGWSVMVTGRAEEVADPVEQQRLAALRAVPWRSDPSLRWIRIVPSEITGRRILGVRPFPRPKP
jgi:nitroimidazol reductase NimA-like FMN-containing flavoprotein (pyridoxamine 5'-phosphate oxidase superfamily)